MPGVDALLTALLDRIRHDCLEAHERTLSLVSDLTEEQLRRQAGAHAPSIAFHLWHLARWAEHDVELIDATPQRWHTGAMAAAWGFPPSTGEDDTGTELGDDASALLVFPDEAALLDYARFALGAMDAVVERITRDPAQAASDPQLVANLCVYMTHDNRHLGMIEALIGAMGIPGTATR